MQGPSPVFFRDFLFDLFCISMLFSCRLFQEVSGWIRCLEICVAQALFVKFFSQMVGTIVLEKVTFSGMRSEKQQRELNFGIDHIILSN